MADTNHTSLPLQQLIATLDTSRLPVVLQVCSGIYFQGLFKQVPERQCRSLAEMLHERVLGAGSPRLPFLFFSRCELTPDPALVVVGAGTMMEAFAVEPGGTAGEGRMWCRVSGSRGGSVVVILP
ncbi:hypothetical protein CRUP_000915, partial [Coryphaenoides rupestris]